MSRKNELLADEEASQRILAIAKILGDGKSHKAGDIAFKIGASSKTVRRHLRFMRVEWQLPITSNREGFRVSIE